MSWRHLCKTSWDGLKTSWRRRQNLLKIYWKHFCKTAWRRFQDFLARHLGYILKTSWRRFKNVFKTFWRRMTKKNILVLIKTSSRHLEDVFWRRMIKVNIFVLIKTSWKRLLKIQTKDVFKTSSSRRMFAGKPTSSTLGAENLITEDNCWERGF